MTDSSNKYIMDEGFLDHQLSNACQLELRRMSMRMTHSAGLPVGERYSDRYETEVGGQSQIVTQSFDAEGNIISKNTGKTKQWDSVIVDYEDDGKRYTLSMAIEHDLPIDLINRLKERISQYEDRINNIGI